MKNYIYEVNGVEISSLFEERAGEIESANSVLIQIFSGERKEKFAEIVKFVQERFVDATVIAASTDGEICNENVLTESTVISVSLFDATDLRSKYIDSGSSFDKGVLFAKELVTPRTKLLLAFADGLECNGEEFLRGIYSIAPQVIVAGGLSGDNSKFENCLVGRGAKLYNSGTVVVAFDSDVLQVNSFYNFGWKGIGVQQKVTKSEKNRVYTIGNLTAVEFYEKYLGKEIAKQLPKIGVEFPLIIEKNYVDIARAVVVKHDDGSLSFAGNIEEGEKVRIGIGDVEEIVTNPITSDKVNVEAFYIYSCMARRRFIPNLIQKEITPFANLAPTSGFFTYGEFFTKDKPELLNQTLTAVALSESEAIYSVEHIVKDVENNTTHKALKNILHATTEDLCRETLRIEEVEKELAVQKEIVALVQKMARMASWELILETEEVIWSEESYKIYKRDPKLEAPTREEFIYEMVLPEYREKVIELIKNAKNGENHTLEIKVRRDDGKVITVFDSAKMIFRDGQPYKIVGITIDLTEMKMKDDIISQQSKLAQMGEMVNMIAHQWRQPLNAVSAASIKLSMQDEMDLLTSEKLQETTAFIGEMVQEMSKTIDDFMNFTKPTDTKEPVLFHEIVDDIMHLMKAQLKNHNIEFIQEIDKNLSLLTYRKDVEHVLINLFSNARDAFEEKEIEKKYIKLKVFFEGKDCIVQVSDNAGGIPADVIDRIFDPYFTTKVQGKGTGLGLYMSKKLLETTIGATISVKNINDGAEFTIVMQDCVV